MQRHGEPGRQDCHLWSSEGAGHMYRSGAITSLSAALELRLACVRHQHASPYMWPSAHLVAHAFSSCCCQAISELLLPCCAGRMGHQSSSNPSWRAHSAEEYSQAGPSTIAHKLSCCVCCCFGCVACAVWHGGLLPVPVPALNIQGAPAAMED